MQQFDTRSKTKRAWDYMTKSYACLALLALVMFDVGARFTYKYWPIDHYNSPNRSFIWWSTRDFASIDYRPDYMLMGSSLMMAALHGGDALYTGVPQNVAFHHRSMLLEQLLAQRTQLPIKTFAFAIGGQMASDAYAIATTLFRDEKKPKTVVYGIAPRDFMDNTLTSPASTETFRYMSRLRDMPGVEMSARPSFWERLDFVCGKISFLYGHRLDLVYLQNKYSRQILKAVCHIEDLTNVHAPFDLRKIAMFELPEDNGPNEVFILPYKSTDKYCDNIPEYKSRYRAFKQRLFDVQFGFLNKMLDYCDREGINVVLVNMPLTEDNVAIMPPGFYDYYKQQMEVAASTHHAEMLDLNDPRVFTKDCFGDSVHLNGKGGKRFFEQLASKLVTGSQIAVSKRASVR